MEEEKKWQELEPWYLCSDWEIFVWGDEQIVFLIAKNWV